MSSSAHTTPGRGLLRTASTRGVVTGAVLAALGLWSVLVPLIGPYFGYALSPAGPWTRPWAALWLQIVPGGALLLAGILLMLTQHRLAGLAAGALAAAAGAWLAVGFALWSWKPAGTLVGGAAAGDGISAAEQIGMASGLGAVVTLLAGLAVGRFTVRGTRDVAAADRQRRQHRWEGHTGSGSDPVTRVDRGTTREPGPAGARPAVPPPRQPGDRQARRKPTDA